MIEKKSNYILQADPDLHDTTLNYSGAPLQEQIVLQSSEMVDNAVDGPSLSSYDSWLWTERSVVSSSLISALLYGSQSIRYNTGDTVLALKQF